MERISCSFTFISIFIISSLVCTGLSEDTDGNCQLFHKIGENGELEELLDYEWINGVDLPTIDDTTKPGTIIGSFKHNNSDNINSITSNTEDDYLNVLIDRDYLHIEVARSFADYEECEVIRLNIKDTNNHAPEFLDAPYKFNLPVPISKGYDFDLLGKIVARDIDLTNKHVTFTLKDDDNSKGFSIASNGKDKKNYPAKFMVSDTVDLENDVTLVVYATDSGKPPLTSNTTITIIIDKGNSAPRFAHVLYTANLTKVSYDEVKEIEVNFLQGSITLERGFEGVRSFEISGVPENHKKHLQLTHSGMLRKYNIELQLNLVNLTKEFLSQGVLSLIVTAVKDTGKAETAVQIFLPEVKSKDDTIKSPKYEEKIAAKDDSTNGYMVATILLSLSTVGLLGYIIYLFVYRNK